MSEKVELSDVERLAFTELVDALTTRAQWWRHRSTEAQSSEVKEQRLKVAEELELVAGTYAGALES